MAILNGKYKVKNSKNSYDVIHLETSANQVIFNDGKTFQEKLDSGVLKGDKGDTGLQGLKGDKGDKGDAGKDGLTTSVTVGSTKYTHSNGNITIPAYPTLSSLGAASSSHTHNEYVNQNAFSNVKVGTTTVAADRTTDTIELKAGSNIVLNPDTTNDAITIAVNGLTVTSSEKSTWNNKVDKNNPVMTGDSLSFNRKDDTTIGTNSIAIGLDTRATNENSIAIGKSVNTTGMHAVGIGVSSHATGRESIAIGSGNQATGVYATALGKSTKATNEYSLSTGCWTTSDGIAASTFGNGSYTNGWGAMASGIVTKAHGLVQHVFGQYNKPDDNVCGTVGSANYNYSAKSKNLMIVGNGNSSALSNAYELDWNGNGWFAGNVTVNGTPTNGNHAITLGYLNSLKPQPGKYFVNGVAAMTSDGVMEIGKYIDFHNTSDETKDYSTRLLCNGSTGNNLTLPTTSGALITKEEADSAYAKSSHTHASVSLLSSPSRNSTTTANITPSGKAGISTMLASTQMKTGKPAGDGHITNYGWDNNGNWDAQLFIPDTADKPMQWRSQGGKAWGTDGNDTWHSIYSTNNKPTPSELGAVASSTVATITKLTQAQYNALTTKDSNTLYIIVG